MRINLAPEFTLSEAQDKEVLDENGVGARSVSAQRIWNARGAKYRKPGNPMQGVPERIEIDNATERKMWTRIDRALKLALKAKADSVELSEDQVDEVVKTLEAYPSFGDEALWSDELCESMKADRAAHKALETAAKNGAKTPEPARVG